MFEKEAEEIAKDIYIHHFDDDVNYPAVLKAITVGVQKGAEFGYNKGFKEGLKQKLNITTISDAPFMERERLEQAKEIILMLYNAGRDILMCGYTEETQKRLSERINSDKIENFLKENT